MRALWVLVSIAMWMTAGAAGVFAAPEPGTLEDARATFKARNYPECLKKIGSALASNPKPTPDERYDLLMMRGECLLKLKQSVGAISAFETASGIFKDKGDVARVAQAKALATLTKEAPGGRYKNKNGEELDIADSFQRKQALLALFEERSVKVRPAMDKALSGNSLVPIQKLLPASWELYTLEFTAIGEAPITLTKVKEMGERARDLIKTELQQINSRVDNLNDLAGEPTLSGNVGNQSISYRGLNSHERDELHGIADTLVKIQPVLEQGRRLNRLFGGTGEVWDGLLADCAEAKETAQQAYDRRY